MPKLWKSQLPTDRLGPLAEVRPNYDPILATCILAGWGAAKCGCVEDTALCHYWSARLRQQRLLCSACDPKIANWHGEFPQELAQRWVSDERGFLIWSKSDVERWLLGQPTKLKR